MNDAESNSRQIGQIIWVNGPVVRVRGSQQVGMLEVVEVGDEHLVGEVIGLERDVITVQVYEETSGLHPGAAVYGTGLPLSVELGPGLLQGIFDGIQRPLPVLELRSGAFIGRGIKTTPLYHKQKWAFTPQVEAGSMVQGGAILGTVPETPLLEHRVMLHPDLAGKLTWVAPAGEYTLLDPIAHLTPLNPPYEGGSAPPTSPLEGGQRGVDGERTVTMLQRWPVRRPRPYRRRLPLSELLVTGQRVLDAFFPLAKGGTAAIPGGFGAGKTVTQHQVAKWSDADVVIYVGCGERGNEMTEVLQEFPGLIDPKSGRPLMERTVLIANTSNMPVAAREASIYTGVTLAEYYRDMGYHVAIMADSTSRWAEALREISGRLEEMPAEGGYPAYLAARLAEFYERAGYVDTLSGTRGSVSIIGAVSPPGGDFSEPVTQHTRRFIRCFWALDKSLASARHFPAISWLDSYSEYVDEVAGWWEDQGYASWHALRKQALSILQHESHLQQIVKLVGPDALPDDQRLVLETARLLREGFLQQNALDEIDSYSNIQKQIRILEIILHFHSRAAQLVAKGCPIVVIHDLPIVNTIVRMKDTIPNEEKREQPEQPSVTAWDKVQEDLDKQMDELGKDYS
ncbi:MAG: V-type ATP synthase subunit A [Anaerolineae bacterium]|nr:V-type ATP synthase subunit A [Anaerolineae bacterium]